MKNGGRRDIGQVRGTRREGRYLHGIQQEFHPPITHLDSTVAPISHNDIPIRVHSYSSGGIELPIALAMGAKLEEELSIGTVHLAWERTGDWGLGNWLQARGKTLEKDEVEA